MIYRTEHPRPQFERKDWLNLNGPWEFEKDPGCSGEERGLFEESARFSQEIQVPFCPESALSGVRDTDFMPSVWYKRRFSLSKEQLQGRVLLHFGAVDYLATVYVNGKKAGTHAGGYVSFSFDVTSLVREGENTVTLWAQDDTRSRLTPSGKQARQYASFKCYYTRTTGIWQTVWLEFVPRRYIVSATYYPDALCSTLTLHASLSGAGDLTAEAFYEGRSVGKSTVSSRGGEATLCLSLSETHLWEVGKGRLYDLVLTFGEDRVKSYFGLRSIRLDGNRFLINEVSVFQRLVLDQGFYPDGIYTAPSDQDLVGDIQRSLAMGFNGARLHEKVFEERFLYHCDRLGYLVWGEFPNWGLDHSFSDAIYGILPEWMEVIRRDFNHPAIIGWCPFNETWDVDHRKQFDPLLETVYKVTKNLDPTRPCIDTSGNFHVITDVYDLHDYTQDPAEFASHYEALGKTNEFHFRNAFADRQIPYDGKMPFFISEYGGIRWTEEKNGWGYGNAPATKEEFLARLKGLTDPLLDDPGMFGLCYTQLTDVEQEQNGLYTYRREAKFPPEVIRAIFSRKAAIED